MGEPKPSYTATERKNPPGFFRLLRTGTIHLVRRVTDVTWSRGGGHTSVTFKCGNLATTERGELSATQPYRGRLCDRCVALKGERRARTARVTGRAW